MHPLPRISTLRFRRRELPDTVALARYLTGKILVREAAEGRMSGRIVETEAYVVGDPAGHAFHGPTTRNRTLYLERGHAYVYFIYGSSYMVNVTSKVAGVGAGVLLWALEPLEGIEFIQRRRGLMCSLDLARGPRRLASALGIDRRFDGADLRRNKRLWLGTLLRVHHAGPIGESARIGVVTCPHFLYQS